MNTYAITQLLAADNYIIVNKSLIDTFDLETAVLIGELCSEYNYWYKNNKLEDDSFYSTRENLENNTGLSKYQQQTIIEKLCNVGLLSVVKKGMPAKNYYTIHAEVLEEILSSQKIRPQVGAKFDLNNNNTNNNNISNILSKDNILEENDTASKSYSKEELKEDFLGSRSKTTKPKKKRVSLFDKCRAETASFSDDFVLQSLLDDYLTIRLNMKDKPIYGVNQWIGLLNKLSEFDDMKAVVRQSIERGWASFYDVKSTTQSTPATIVDKTDDDIRHEQEIINKMKEEGKQWEF